MPFRLSKHDTENITESCRTIDVKQWLGDGSTLTALSGHDAVQHFAITNGSCIVVMQLGKKTAGGVLKEKARYPFRRFNMLGQEGNVTVMKWVRSGKSKKDPVLAVGTSNGVLMILSYKTALLHKQKISTGNKSIVSIQGSCFKADGSFTELLLLVSPATLVTIDGPSIAKLADPKHLEPTSADALIRSSESPVAQDTPSTQSVLSSYKREGIPCYIHKLRSENAEDALKDVVPVGNIQGSALDVFRTAPTKWVLTAGKQPAVAAFNVTFEIATASHLAKDAAKKAFSMMKTTFSSTLWGEAKEENTPIVLPKSIKVTPSFLWSDDKREVEKVVPDITGRYVAITDTLGRITVMDTKMFVVVKMLKGYRDASVVWLSNSNHPDRATGVFLVHLPLRGAVEAWKVSKQKRLAAIKVGYECSLLQTSSSDGCMLLYSDGMLAQLTLEQVDDDDDSPTAEEETQTAQMKNWVELCQGTPDLDDLLNVLNKIHNPVDVLECVINVPDSLDHRYWRDITSSALTLLEQRGASIEQDSCDEVKGDHEIATEHTRLKGPNAPHLSEGDVFRYLINRLAVLNAYTLFVTLKTKSSKPNISEEWLEETALLDDPYDPLAPPSSVLAEICQPDHISLSPVLPLKVFFSYFNFFNKSVSLVKVDLRISEFICNPLQYSCDTLSRCAHILSLSNRTILELLLEWGTQPRGLNVFVSIDSLARLLTAPFCDSMDERLPKWLLNLHTKEGLQHCAFLVVAGKKKLKETAADDYKIALIDGWINNLLALMHFRSILPQDQSWIQSLSLLSMTSVSPAAVAAAACLGKCLDDFPELAKYIDLRESRDAFNAHSAMLLVFLHLKERWPRWQVKKLCVTDTWMHMATDTGHDSSTLDLERIKQYLDASGVWLRPAVYWCTAVMLTPIGSLFDICRMRKASPAASCKEIGKGHAAVQEHCELLRQLLALLPEEEEEIPPYSKEWWRITPYDAMLCNTYLELGGREVSKKEPDTLLKFLRLCLFEDMLSVEPFTVKSVLHWDGLFAKDALALLEGSAFDTAGRSDFVSDVMSKVETSSMMDVGTKLCESLDISDTSFTLFLVVSRLHLEGHDSRANDTIGSAVLDSSLYLPFLTRVVRLRLKHILSSAVAGGCSQKRSERSLNLVSGLPLEVVEWVNDINETPEEEALVLKSISSVPTVTASHRLKTLIYRVLQHPSRTEALDKPTLLKLQEAQNFAAYLLKNV
eukprot:TRINITY_DN9388_c0_g1_i1.p1 TRINITY_DN9388_c0_g1~~TRINITY_DN9388_c0_g1_i1.p1  ORF type:complete len:1224 (+),score=204.50 TRINITY_DN9388_c0_g1_i1:2928-6599(+)